MNKIAPANVGEVSADQLSAPMRMLPPGRPGSRHNLALQPTRLIGRERELQEAKRLLLSDQVRLLTLTGPAGVGKTRLALAVAAELQPGCRDGAWFIDLAPVQEPELVATAICKVLGVGDHGHLSSFERLKEHLAERQILLILDSFEQVRCAGARIAELLATCPWVRIVVTSRARLRLRWEQVLLVEPLAFTVNPTPTTPEAVSELPAVALFLERARASRPDFDLTEENVEAVAALSVHLEGLPLAIELAAARANALTPAEMVSWVERRLPSLSWDAQDLPVRQQTLRDALSWSYTLLSAPEQALFRRLGVFTGGWTFDAATCVAQAELLGLDPRVSLPALVDASLVQASHSVVGESRFTMLETLREFAWEQLEASGELDETRRQHASYYLAVAETADVALRHGPNQREWYDQLEREHENLRTVLTWSAETNDAQLELRLAGSLARFWRMTGRLREGYEWLTDGLARTAEQPAELRLRALHSAGLLASYLGEFTTGQRYLDEALELARAVGDGNAAADAIGAMLRAASLQGSPERGPDLAARLMDVRATADPAPLGYALHNLGILAFESGHYAAASAYLEEALELRRRSGDAYGVAYILGTLSRVAHAQGDHPRAAALATEALQLANNLGSPRCIAWCTYLALPSIQGRATPPTMARVLAAADAARLRVSFPLGPHLQAKVDGMVRATRETLGESQFGSAWGEARTMTPSQFVTEMVTLLDQPRAPAPIASPPHHQASEGPLRAIEGPLSPREQEVLQLVASGLTNKQIADRLIISVATVNYHVTSVLTKLCAENRTQAVSLATQQGIL